MKKTELKTLKETSLEGLNDKLLELRKEQFKLRLSHRTGQLEGTHEVRNVRRNIARVKQTIRLKGVS